MLVVEGGSKVRWPRKLLEDKAELALYNRCKVIVRKIERDESCELTVEERTLLEAMNHVAWARAYDVFSEVVGGTVWHDNPEEKALFKLRLYLFVNGEIEGRNKRVRG